MSATDRVESLRPPPASSYHALASAMQTHLRATTLPATPNPGVPDLGDAIARSWASVLAVLTFYEERIAAESYLPTAREEWSLRELAKMLGYTPSPGVAASSYIAFTLSSSRGLESPVLIKAGTSVRNAPLKGGQPQVFETTTDLHADAAYNAMPARVAPPDNTITVRPQTRVLTVSGFPAIRPNEALLLTAPGSTLAVGTDADVRRVQAVTPQPQKKTTVIGVSVAPPRPNAPAPIPSPEITKLQSLGNLFGHDAIDWQKAPPTTQAKYGVPLAGPFASHPTLAASMLMLPLTDMYWTAQRDGLGDDAVTCAVSFADTVCAGTAGGGIFTTRWPSDARLQNEPPRLTWATTNRGLTSKEVYSLATGPKSWTKPSAPGDDRSLYAGTSRGAVWRSVDGGQQWDQVRGSTTTIVDGKKIVTPSTKLPNTTVRALLVIDGFAKDRVAGTDDDSQRLASDLADDVVDEGGKVADHFLPGAGVVADLAQPVADDIADDTARDADKIADDTARDADKIAQVLAGGLERSAGDPHDGPALLTHLADGIGGLRQVLTELRDDLKQLATALSAKPRKRLATKVTPIQHRIDEHEARVIVLQGSVARLLTELEGLKIQVTTLAADLASLQAGLTTLLGEIATLRTDVKTLVADAGAKADRAVIDADMTNVKGDISKLGDEITALETALTNFDAAVTRVIGDIEQLSVDLGAEDADGPVLFAGTDQGLYAALGLDGGWGKVAAIGNSVVYDLAISGDDLLMVATSDGVAQIKVSAGANSVDAVHSPKKQQWNHGPATVLACRDTTWFAATANGVCTTEAGSWNWTRTLEHATTSLLEATDGMLAGTDAGLQKSIDGTNWKAVTSTVDWPPGVVPPPPPQNPPPPPSEIAFRSIVALSAISGGPTIAFSGASGYANTPDWPRWRPTGGCPDSWCLDLANGKAKVGKGQKVIVTQTGQPALTLEVADVDVIARTDYGTTANVTRLTFTKWNVPPGDQNPLDAYDIRQAEVFAVAPADAARFQPHVDPSTVTISPAPPSVPTYGTAPATKSTTGATEPAVLFDGGQSVSPEQLKRPGAEPSDATRTPTTYVRGNAVPIDAPNLIPRGRLVAVTGVRCRTSFTPPGGVACYDPESEEWTRPLDDWTVTSVEVVEGPQSFLVAATEEGPVLHTAWPVGAAASWTDSGFPSATRRVTTMLASNVGTLVAGTDDGSLYRWCPPTEAAAPGTWIRFARNSPAIHAITTLGSQGDLLLGTRQGAWTVHPEAGEVVTAESDGLNGHIRAFCAGPGQTMLAATSDGVWRRSSKGRWTPFGTGIEHRDVVGLGRVRGRYYAATKSAGVLTAGDEEVWRTTGWRREEGCATPSSMAVTTDLSVVVGTEHDGLRRLALGATEWERLEIGCSASIRTLRVRSAKLLAGTARSVVARDDRNRQHPIKNLPVTVLEQAQQGEHPTDQLDEGVLPPSVTSALTKKKIKLPKHYNVTVKQPGLKWEVDNLATPIVITLIAGAALSIEMRPTANPLVSETQLDAADSLSDWSVDLGAAGPATVRAFFNEVKLLTGSATDEPVAEVHVVDDSTVAPGRSVTLHLQDRLQTWYDATSVTVSANVVEATQGETTSGDVLGSGNASATFQHFMLGRSPLTYIPSSSPTGASPTLSVFVGQRGNVLPGTNTEPASSAAEWQPVDTLMSAGPGEHAYMTREVVDNDDKVNTEVVFGDGVNGARLPSGAGNVTARYRVGVGGPSLPAGSLSVLGAGPIGVRRVLNPVASNTGQPPASFDDLRTQLPAWSLATNRIVSLGDYTTFTEQFAGIDKTDVVNVYDGRRESINITVGGLDGLPFSDDDVTGRLRRSIATHRVGNYPFDVATYDVEWFALRATINASDRADAKELVESATRALVDEFGVVVRLIGQSLERVSVQIVLESIDGCIDATIDRFHTLGCPQKVERRLAAARARYDPRTGRVLPATVVALSENDLHLTVSQT